MELIPCMTLSAAGEIRREAEEKKLEESHTRESAPVIAPPTAPITLLAHIRFTLLLQLPMGRRGAKPAALGMGHRWGPRQQGETYDAQGGLSVHPGVAINRTDPLYGSFCSR